jgi:predicted nucleic acid-binding protein
MPEPLVVDASFTFRLVLPGPEQDRFRLLVDGWLRDGYELHAPTLWVYEMTSALCKVVRFGELTPAEGRHSLALAQTLGIQLMPPDIDQVRTAFDWTLRLERAAAYDSFYLALAESLRCDLWTADRHLCNAVEQSWVRWAGDQ